MSYKAHYSKACSQYGASMGRRNVHVVEDRHADFRVHLVRVPLDQGGYDPGGAYWGGGRDIPRLYRYETDDGTIEAYVRAWDREEAKREIQKRYPNVRFYR
jgi:hypothetical protein